MSWLKSVGNLIWTNGNPVNGGAAPVPTPPPVPTNIKMYSIGEVAPLLGVSLKIQISLIKEGCKMCNIPFAGGGVIFINKKPSIEEEHNEIKKQLAGQLSLTTEYVVAYAKQDRDHPQYSYYAVIAIRSSDMLDLKKAFKVQKLKAFL